jgi:hypothetical protein
MRKAFVLLLVVALGLITFWPSSAQAGPFIYRGGAWDRMAETGYAFPNLWNNSNNYGYYNNGPIFSNNYDRSGYWYPNERQPLFNWGNIQSGKDWTSPSHESSE